MKGIICGTGAYLPSRVMDNHDIAQLVETSDEWIRERTGVVERHIIDGDTTVSMACEAGRRALADAGMEAEELDLILVATISSNVILPCTACEVQKELGAKKAACFDIGGAACSGFVLAYNTALAYLASGVYRNVLIIGSESLSNLTNWRDRGTCILFGDGAGAAVLRAEEGQVYLPVMHSDGSRSEALTCRSRHDRSELSEAVSGELTGEMDAAAWLAPEYFMQMDGQRVFKFAARSVPEVIREVLALNQIEQTEVDWFIVHQANRRIIEAVAKRLGEPMEKFPTNMQKYGNTSSASIPILLDELKQNGKLKSGQKIVFAGFGAGLIWCASVLEWQ